MDDLEKLSGVGQSLWTLFERGGSFMWPLLILSVVVVTLTFYKFIEQFLFQQTVSKFRRYLRTNGSKGSSRLIPFIDNFNVKLEVHKEILNNSLQLHFDRRTRILGWFTALGTGSSMIGFIGTVSGMISAFDAISQAEQVSVQLTASGISEALITTGFGLIVAVFCVIVETILRYSQVKLAHQLEAEMNIYLFELEH